LPPEHATKVHVIRTAMRTSDKTKKRFFIPFSFEIKMPQVTKTYGTKLFFAWGKYVHVICGTSVIL
jgi:hypothetical protein